MCTLQIGVQRYKIYFIYANILREKLGEWQKLHVMRQKIHL